MGEVHVPTGPELDDKEIPEVKKLPGSPLEQGAISNRCWFSLLSLGESSD